MGPSEIIHRIRKRDKEALSHLYDNYAAALNGIIWGILPIEHLAEEALQQTFIKIWGKIDQYDESKMILFTWMTQIARNTAIEIKSLNPDVQNTETGEIESPNQVNSTISNGEMKTLIENLDEEHRKVIEYIYLKGFSQSQTAEELKISLDTVKTRLQEALTELRRILKDKKEIIFGALPLFIPIIVQLCL